MCLFGKACVTNPVIDREMKAEKLRELLEIIPLIIARCSYNNRQPFCENSGSRLTTHNIIMRKEKQPLGDEQGKDKSIVVTYISECTSQHN